MPMIAWQPGKIPAAIRHAAILREIANRCRDVCLSGIELEKGLAAVFCEGLTTAENDWAQEFDEIDVRFDGQTLAVCLRDIVAACASPGDWELARGRDWMLETSIVSPDLWEAMEAASTDDAEYLRSLRLGNADATGKPIPPSFFDRPLWACG